MSEILPFLRDSLRTNFGATVFSIVMGFIGVIFVGYLTIDGIKTLVQNSRRKKMHREEHNVHRS
jgi:hypothetical protein